MDEIILNDQQIQSLRKAIKDGSDIQTMIDSQRESLKELILAIHEETKIPKKILAKMIKTYHKSNFPTVLAEQQEFETLYQSLIQQK